MSFWKTFGFHTVSAIDTLIESGDFTLEQLLDEEEILQETKSQNKKLLDFLTEPETLKKLLTYITIEPKEEDDPKRKFKYPFLACEILASEVWAICDAMYQDHSLLNVLYGYFEKDPPLNPLLSSYSSRVAGILLQKKVAETIEYMKERRDIIGQFLKHLGNASVMDLLLKVIQCEDSNDGVGVLEWLCTTDLISALVAKFEPHNSAEVHENAAQALVDIILVSMNSSSSPLIAQIESQVVLEKLFSFILTDELSSGLLHGLTVVIELLRRHVNEQHDNSTKVEELPSLFKLIVAHLPKLHSYLSLKTRTNNRLTVVMPLPSGEFEPLGFYRLKVIEFFAILIVTNYGSIDAEIMKTGVLSTCLSLFFQYPWNNFLHSTVEQVIQTILDGENEELKIHLLRDAKLLDRICEASRENDEECAKPKGVRRGYMGHITSISTSIINIATTTPSIERLLTSSESWTAYVKGALASTREKESKSLAYMPSDFAVDENEEGDEYDDNGDDYSPEEQDQFRLDQDDEDEEEDEEEEGVVMQSRRIDDGEEDTIESEVWEEKEIQDTEESTPQQQQQENQSQSEESSQKHQQQEEDQPQSTEPAPSSAPSQVNTTTEISV